MTWWPRPRPDGWDERKIGTLFRLVGGGTPSTNEPRFWNGTIPWITSADVDESGYIEPRRFISGEAIRTSAVNLVPAGSIVVVMRVGLGKVALAPYELCFSQDCQALLPDFDRFDPQFVRHQLRLFASVLRFQGRGTTISGLTKRQLAELPFRYPPKQLQTEIAETIEALYSRLDDAVVALKRVQANVKRYLASVLKAACEGGLVPTEAELARREGRTYESANVLLERILEKRRLKWEEDELSSVRGEGKDPASRGKKKKKKYKEPAAPKIEGLPRLPEGWCWASLPQLGELNRGKSRHRPRNDPRLLGGSYPFVQTGEVTAANTFIRHHEQSYSEAGLAQSRLWPAGTLCITIAANIAETGILTFDACFPDSVVGFLSPEYPVLVRFVEMFIRTARNNLARYAPATAQKNINIAILSRLAIPLPPLSEQVRIVDEVDRRLAVADHVTQTAESVLKRGGRLRIAVLNDAFAGRLTHAERRERTEKDGAGMRQRPAPWPTLK